MQGLDQGTVDNSMERFLDECEQNIAYDAWFCGHWHLYKRIDKLTFLYQDIVGYTQPTEDKLRRGIRPMLHRMEGERPRELHGMSWLCGSRGRSPSICFISLCNNVNRKRCIMIACRFCGDVHFGGAGGCLFAGVG